MSAVAVFADRAVFADAACVGRWSWTDPPERGEPAVEVADRHRLALALCSRCPCRASCAALAATLPPGDLVGAVLAGRVRPDPRAAGSEQPPAPTTTRESA